MRRVKINYLLMVLAVATVLAVVGSARGEEPRTGEPWGTEIQSTEKPTRPLRYKGNVIAMEDLLPIQEKEQGWILHLNVDGKDMRVHLGPQWMVPIKDNLNLTEGEPLVVEGIRINLDDPNTIEANEITQGENAISPGNQQTTERDEIHSRASAK